MNPAEATEVLALCAGFDGRKPNPDHAKLWALALDGVRVDDAKRAVIVHYQETHRWIMPADVIQGVRRIVMERHEERKHADLPPELEAMEDGPEFTAAYLEWLRSGQVPQTALSA